MLEYPKLGKLFKVSLKTGEAGGYGQVWLCRPEGEVRCRETTEPPRVSGDSNPDYSGFPHTEACNACSTRVSGETRRSPDR